MPLRPDPRNHAPTAQTAPASQQQNTDGDDKLDEWLSLAQSAFYSSTSYVDENYRKTWEDSLRAFNNQHSSDSKYNQASYDKRSRVYRPKARTIIRKNEAMAAAAFFSNTDVVSVTAQDQSSKVEAASAAIMKELLQYRLTKSIPWFQIVLGGLQDAQTIGAVVAHLQWKYKAKEPDAEVSPVDAPVEEDVEYPAQPAMPQGAMQATPEGGLTGGQPPGEEPPAAMPAVPPQGPQGMPPGQAGAMPPQQGDAPLQPLQPSTMVIPQPEVAAPRVLMDRPDIELVPIENIRVDPAANWMDPINSSPYVIHIMPMYVLDVKSKMNAGEWIEHSDAEIMAATQYTADSTRAAREKGRTDPANNDNAPIDAYAVVWVQRHIHRKDDEDWEFYTLSDQSLLTEPVRLSEVVLHGVRPYVMGCCVLETHRIMPSSLPTLGKGLLDEANEVSNQRLDNVKFVLNKMWKVKRGKEADIAGLIRNVPGRVVMLDDPEKDAIEVNWPDVTQSSFAEHQGINMELDELFGNFNPAALMQNGPGNQPARNMAMVAGANGTLVEYLIRTYVETFVQPVLRQLVQMEQAYETDQVIMKIAAKRAKVFQKYGIDHVTDELLKAELTLTVNVGMGATDPMQKLQKLLMGVGQYVQMLKVASMAPGVDFAEIGKEIFGLLGYLDGSRFFNGDNPQVMALQKQVQQLSMMIKMKNPVEVAKVKGQHDIQKTVIKGKFDLQKAGVKNQGDIQKVAIKESNENKRALASHWSQLHGMGRDHGHAIEHQAREHHHERLKQDRDHAHDRQKSAADWVRSKDAA